MRIRKNQRKITLKHALDRIEQVVFQKDEFSPSLCLLAKEARDILPHDPQPTEPRAFCHLNRGILYLQAKSDMAGTLRILGSVVVEQ